jgi:excisionase family DNA binding protein
MNNENLITCDELAEIIQIDRQVIQKWARENKIPNYKVGVGKRITYRFDKNEILEFFKSHDVKSIL